MNDQDEISSMKHAQSFEILTGAKRKEHRCLGETSFCEEILYSVREKGQIASINRKCPYSFTMSRCFDLIISDKRSIETHPWVRTVRDRFFFLYSSALVYFEDSSYDTPLFNLPRNVAVGTKTTYSVAYTVLWNGQFIVKVLDGSTRDRQVNNLRPGRYRIKFSALKHFGNSSIPNDFEVYHSPPFDLSF